MCLHDLAAHGALLCGELEGKLGPGTGFRRAPVDQVSGQRNACPGTIASEPGQQLITAAGKEFHANASGSCSAGKYFSHCKMFREPQLSIHADTLKTNISVRQAGQAQLRLLGALGKSIECLEDYRRTGGNEALRRAFEWGPSGVIREVIDSKLVGRGGAAIFPRGKKWEAGASAAASGRLHYGFAMQMSRSPARSQEIASRWEATNGRIARAE